MKFRAFCPLALGVAALACGGAPPPTHQRAQTQGRLEAAMEAGADEVPQAALHLKMARDQIRQAEMLIEMDEMENARLVLQRAEADASVALELARATAMRRQAQEARDKVNDLRIETMAETGR